LIRGFALLVLIFATATGRATASDEPSCASITDDHERLACYDRLAAQKAGTPAAVEPAAPANTNAEPQIGDASLPAKSKVEEPRHLQARIIGRVIALRKGTKFKLDNGQIWQSIDDDNNTDEVDFLDPVVTIDRNFIGHYWMDFGRSAPQVLVKRVQ